MWLINYLSCNNASTLFSIKSHKMLAIASIQTPYVQTLVHQLFYVFIKRTFVHIHLYKSAYNQQIRHEKKFYFSQQIISIVSLKCFYAEGFWLFNFFLFQIVLIHQQDQKSLDAVEGKTNKTDSTEKDLTDLTE